MKAFFEPDFYSSIDDIRIGDERIFEFLREPGPGFAPGELRMKFSWEHDDAYPVKARVAGLRHPILGDLVSVLSLSYGACFEFALANGRKVEVGTEEVAGEANDPSFAHVRDWRVEVDLLHIPWPELDALSDPLRTGHPSAEDLRVASEIIRKNAPGVQRYASRVLYDAGEAGIPFYRAFLADADPEQKRRGAFGLIRFSPDPAAIEVILEVVRNSDKLTRVQTARYLVERGCPVGALADAVSALPPKDIAAVIRYAINGVPASREPFKTLMTHPAESVREGARQVFGA